MTGLRTDSGRLAELSAEQESIVAERAGHESRVDEIGTDLSDDWSGQSAAAFGQAGHMWSVESTVGGWFSQA
jgi:hypothetical protein